MKKFFNAVVITALLCGLCFWGFGFNADNEITLGIGSFFIGLFGLGSFIIMLRIKKFFPATIIILLTSFLFLDAIIRCC